MQRIYTEQTYLDKIESRIVLCKMYKYINMKIEIVTAHNGTNFLAYAFKSSQMFFGLGGFYGRQNSICETKGLTWSNIEWISSISVLY